MHRTHGYVHSPYGTTQSVSFWYTNAHLLDYGGCLRSGPGNDEGVTLPELSGLRPGGADFVSKLLARVTKIQGSSHAPDTLLKLWLAGAASATVVPESHPGSLCIPRSDNFREMVESYPPAPLCPNSSKANSGLSGARFLRLHMLACQNCSKQPDETCPGSSVAYLIEHGFPVPMTGEPEYDPHRKDYCHEDKMLLDSSLADMSASGAVEPSPSEGNHCHLPRFVITQSSWVPEYQGASAEALACLASGRERTADPTKAAHAKYTRRIKERVIVDARHVNSKVWLTRMELPDPFQLARKFPRDSFLFVLDLKGCFSQYSMAEPVRPLFGIGPTPHKARCAALPFGLRSSPYSACTATAAIVDLIRKLCPVLYAAIFVDDLIGCSASKADAEAALARALAICKFIGLPVSTEKIIHPTQRAKYLGCIYDTRTGNVSVPADKIRQAASDIDDLGQQRICPRALLSVCGRLYWIARIATHLRPLLQSLWHISPNVSAALQMVKRRQRNNRLSQTDSEAVRSILASAASVLQNPRLSSTKIQRLSFDSFSAIVESDAGTYGLGIFGGEEVIWMTAAGPRPSAISGWDITSSCFRELLPVAIGLTQWGRAWSGRQVIWILDSSSAVHALLKMSSPRESCNKLLQHIACLLATHEISIWPTWRRRSDNQRCDDLSRCVTYADAKSVVNRWLVKDEVPYSLIATTAVSGILLELVRGAIRKARSSGSHHNG